LYDEHNELVAIAHTDRPPAQWNLHNNLWELLAAPEMVVALLEPLRGRTLIIRTDNTYTLSYLKRGGGSCPLTTALVQSFYDLLIEMDIDLVGVEYIPGAVNVVADWSSRYVDSRGDWAIKQVVLEQVWDWIRCMGLPPFTIDGFASAANHVVPLWVSRFYEPGATYVDFFSAPIPEEAVLWINPPFSVLHRTLIHLRRSRHTAYVVAPLWPDTPWFGPLQTMSQAVFTLPEDAFTSITLGHQQGYHAVPYLIQVHFCPRRDD